MPLAGAQGNENINPPGTFGLSMHGTPKYSAADMHLTYANPDAPVGGALRSAAIGTFDTLNPYAIKGRAALGLDLVYDRLMARVWDEPFTLYPLIAERADIAPDRSAITFHINPKARFHDGSRISADDVIFTFETLKNEGRPNMRKVYRLVKTVEKRDDLSVHFELGAGYDRETVMILAMMPVLSKTWWSGRVFDTTTVQIPLLNGPYKIAAFEPGRRIVYERVPDYWAKDTLTNVGHHNFERIIYDYYRDDTVAFEAFKAGNLDLRREMDAGKWASAYDFPALRAGDVKMEALPHGRPERTRAFIFNTRRAPFDDIRVRRALGLLFDFEWVNRNLFHDQYLRINSYFPNSELAASGPPSMAELAILNPWKEQLPPEVFAAVKPAPQNADTRQRRKNMLEADHLLKAAGWVVKDGKRMKDGKIFRFEIMLDAPENEKIALHFKRALDKMGIEANIRVLDAAAYRGRLNEYDFDMTLYYWLSTLSPGTEQILFWGCKAAQEPARWNFAGICDPAIDAIASNIAQTQTREGLVAHMRALDRVLMSGHYMIPLYYGSVDYMAYWKQITHPDETPLYGAVLETWWMKKDIP
ncbi:MAG: ABC transporter substrate-binding protein [Alphaproteobacteria bacterium]|nr:ABC transporter substrate-binding protein [Alphaproteobacteria bacterium]